MRIFEEGRVHSRSSFCVLHHDTKCILSHVLHQSNKPTDRHWEDNPLEFSCWDDWLITPSYLGRIAWIPAVTEAYIWILWLSLLQFIIYILIIKYSCDSVDGSMKSNLMICLQIKMALFTPPTWHVKWSFKQSAVQYCIVLGESKSKAKSKSWITKYARTKLKWTQHHLLHLQGHQRPPSEPYITL